MWWEIGVSAAAAAFVVLAGFVIRFLFAAQRTLGETEKTMCQTQQQLETTMKETQQLIRSSIQLLEDARGKLQASDRFFEAVEATGEAVQKVSSTVQRMSGALEQTVDRACRAAHERQDSVNELMSIVTSGMQLWQRWQLSKRTNAANFGLPQETTLKE